MSGLIAPDVGRKKSNCGRRTRREKSRESGFNAKSGCLRGRTGGLKLLCRLLIRCNVRRLVANLSKGALAPNDQMCFVLAPSGGIRMKQRLMTGIVLLLNGVQLGYFSGMHNGVQRITGKRPEPVQNQHRHRGQLPQRF